MQKSYLLVLLFLISFANLSAQTEDCSLDIGGKNRDVLVQVFQMNESQQSQLDIWIAELGLQTKVLEEEIQLLLDSHPQSTEEDLQNLAKKYGRLKDQLLYTNQEYDQKLLGIFNEKQYEFYVELCREAYRRPLPPIIPEEKNEEPIDPPDQED